MNNFLNRFINLKYEELIKKIEELNIKEIRERNNLIKFIKSNTIEIQANQNEIITILKVSYLRVLIERFYYTYKNNLDLSYTVSPKQYINKIINNLEYDIKNLNDNMKYIEYILEDKYEIFKNELFNYFKPILLEKYEKENNIKYSKVLLIKHIDNAYVVIENYLKRLNANINLIKDLNDAYKNETKDYHIFNDNVVIGTTAYDVCKLLTRLINNTEVVI